MSMRTARADWTIDAEMCLNEAQTIFSALALIQSYGFYELPSAVY